MPVINGRKIELVKTKVRGRDIINAVKPEDNRRVVMVKGKNYELVDSEKTYDSKALTDWRGNPVTVSSIPDRTKG
jgi:hypothetical protein